MRCKLRWAKMYKAMNILFVCTSNSDRSPALEQYFKENHPQHEYRSAGVNKYFTTKKGTHYLTQEDVEWAEFIVYADDVHLIIVDRDFEKNAGLPGIILHLGEYKQGQIGEDYILKAEEKILRSVG
jgi:predicted protein tyrosine phosphatase